MSQSTPAGTSGSLASLRIPELQAIAQQLGVKGISKMRKSDLISAISAAQSGGYAPKSAARKTTSKAPAKETAVQQSAEEKPVVASSGPAESASGETEAPARARRSTQRGDRARNDRADRVERTENASESTENTGSQGEGDNAVLVGGVKIELPSAETSERRRNDRNDRNSRNNRNRNRNESGDGNDNAERQDRGNRNDRGRNSAEDDGRNERNDRSDRQDRNDDGDDRGNRRRRGRDRDRDRNRKGQGRNRRNNDLAYDDTDLSEDEVLIPVAGVLDLLDNYAFVRTSGYLPGPNDVYVSLGQVKKAGLRRGDAITGAVRQPRDGDQSNQRQKFNALVRLDSVNGMSPDESKNRPDFNKLTPLYPQERLRLENPESNKIAPRLIDIVAPIGKGQRGLIVAPPKAGKTIIMQQIANSITANNPEVHLMVVLVDERPEEVTDMERTVAGEVIASTFDRPASDHTIVAELAIERAKRLVELGQDVVVLLDSITRLGRAYNLAAPASGRILSGGVDAAALYPPKKFFGAARNIENGGSLTILASALVETGSKMDEVIFEEFKGTGNMELRLSRHLADRRVFPAVDVNASGTRREEILISPEELKITYKLRRVLHNLEQGQALELLIKKLKENKTNVEFLLNIQKTTPDSLVDLDND